MSSTGLSSPVAAVLAYSGWWVTGGIFWWLERRDDSVRLHAAQSVVAFGFIALLIGLFAALAAASLSFLPSMFGFFAGAAGRIARRRSLEVLPAERRSPVRHCPHLTQGIAR